MGASNLSREDFNSFLESQISRIERFQTGETFTLVFIKASRKLLTKIIPTLDNNLRQSDVLFNGGDHLFITLAYTDKIGALHIDEMLKEFIDQDLIYAFASLPEDGEDMDTLLSNLVKICKEEYALDLSGYLS